MNFRAMRETVEALEQELVAIDARRAAVVQAAYTLRSILGPAVAERPGPPIGGDVDCVLEKLRTGGPARPKELADAVGLDRETFRRVMQPLLADGTVIATGHTTGRRYALPDRPAKEALQPRRTV